MFFNKSSLILGITLTTSLIWLFCQTPTPPNFNPPTIKNDTIITEGSRLMGEPFLMYVKISNADNLTYKWYKNDTLIEGEKSDSLKFVALFMNDSGTYKLLVSNPFGSDESKPFHFNVIYVDENKPKITLISPNDSSITADTTIKIRFSVFDESSITSVLVNNSTFTPKDTSIDTLFYEYFISNIKDTINIQIIAEDIVKNIDTATMVFYYNETFGDHEKPYIKLLSHIDSSVVKDSILIISYKILDAFGISFVSIDEKSLKLTDSIYTDTLILTSKINAIKTIAIDNSIHKNSDTLITTIFYIENKAPKWSTDTIKVFLNEGEPYTLNLIDSCSDENGDGLTFSINNIPPENDQIKDTYYLYNPSFSDSGIYYVTITAFDAKVYSSVVLKLCVNNVNRKPEFKDNLPDDFYEVKEGAKLSINFVAIDPDGDAVSYELIKNNLPGQTEFLDSQLVWQSTNNDSGYYSVSIKATDGSLSDTAYITIAVGDVNRPPQISINSLNSEDTVKITEMRNLSLKISATDPDSGNIVWLLPMKNKPPGATYNINSGSFSYTPSFSISNGLSNSTFADLTFFATDSVNAIGNDSFVIHIRVIDSNSAPKWTASEIPLTVNEGQMISYNISSVFSGDDEGEIVTFSKKYGSFNNDTTKWSWIPDFEGQKSYDTVCVITATDNHVPPASSSLSLKLTVKDSTPAVTANTPINVAYNSMTVSWSQSIDSDFGTYKVYYSTLNNVTEASSQAGANIDNIFTTSTTISGLSENTHYYIRVFVYNTNLSKAGSNVVDAKTPVLGAPTIFISSPTLANDSGFLQQASSIINGTASSDAGIASVVAIINGNAVTVTGTDNWSFSTTYATLKAWNKVSLTITDVAGKYTTINFDMFYKPDLSTPAKPVVADITNRSMAVSWSQIQYCDKYLVYRSISGSSGTFVVVKDTTGVGYKDTLLDIGTQYYYKIRGYYSVGGVSDSTEFSGFSDGKTENWFECVYDFGGIDEYGKDIVKISDGYIVVAFSDLSSKKLLVFKINKSGDIVWQERHDGIPKSIERTNDGGFIVAAESMLKIDSNGKYLWDKDYGNNKFSHAYQTDDGGYVTFGERTNNTTITRTVASGDSTWETTFSQISDFGGNYCVDGTIDSDGGYVALSGVCNGGTLISKVNSEGDSLWSFPFYDVSQDTCIDPSAIIQASDGTYVIGGTMSLFNIKRESLGLVHVVWRVAYDDIYFEDVQVTSNGAFIVTGVDRKNSEPEACLVLADIDGTKLWSKTFSLGKSTHGNSVLQADDNGFVICGVVLGVDNKNKIYILKTNENGEIGK